MSFAKRLPRQRVDTDNGRIERVAGVLQRVVWGTPVSHTENGPRLRDLSGSPSAVAGLRSRGLPGCGQSMQLRRDDRVRHIHSVVRTIHQVGAIGQPGDELEAS